MNMFDIVFVDTETTGLHPVNDPIWEVAAIRWNGGEFAEKVWHLPINVGLVSDWVRDNCRFAERYQLDNLTPIPQFLAEFAEGFAPYGDNAVHMAGNVVSFDAQRIERLYLAAGRPVPWHYHLIDVEAVAVGALMAAGEPQPLPWRSAELSERLGVPVPEGTHDALVDARWARDVLCAVAGVRVPRRS